MHEGDAARLRIETCAGATAGAGLYASNGPDTDGARAEFGRRFRGSPLDINDCVILGLPEL